MSSSGFGPQIGRCGSDIATDGERVIHIEFGSHFLIGIAVAVIGACALQAAIGMSVGDAIRICKARGRANS